MEKWGKWNGVGKTKLNREEGREQDKKRKRDKKRKGKYR